MLKRCYFMCVIVVLVGLVRADTITVGPGGSAGGYDHATIQAGINAAVNGDEVIVADGTYTGTGNKNLDFGGRLITVRSENGPETTIIDCEGSGRGFYFHNGETSAARLEGFTITNGNIGGFSNSYGGIWCKGSSPVITNCIISNCQAYRGGGIACAGGGNPTISNCTIIGNTARHSGGGILAYSRSNPIISNCIIAGNTASKGGGIYYEYRSNPVVANSTIINNTASSGSGIWGYGDSMSATNCILWGNLPQQISSSVSVTYSDVQGGRTGEGNIDAAPVFAFEDDYHLMPGSPDIDAGTNSPVGGLDLNDKDGSPRPLDGNGDGNSVADMGAYEYDSQAPIIAVSVPVSEFFATEGDQSLQRVTFSLRNCGGGTLNWQISEASSWMDVLPGSGTSNGEVDEIAVSVDIGGLAVGKYTEVLTINDPLATNNGYRILITLHVSGPLKVPGEYQTIQDAIDAAQDGSVIIVEPDTYYENINFKSKAITVRSVNPDDSNIVESTIIDANGAGSVVTFAGTEGQDSVLQGFTITGGTGTEISSGVWSGGGIRSPGGSPTICQNIIVGNFAKPGHGGGIYSRGSSLIYKNKIMNNSASIGGGMSLGGAKAYNNIVCCNIASSRGGGLYISSSTTIKNNIVYGNSAGTQGGGLHLSSAGGSTVTNNTIVANGSNEKGANLDISRSNNTTITNNIIAHGLNNAGVYVSNPDDYSISFKYNDVWNNEGGNYSRIEDRTGMEGNISDDPLFVNPDVNDYHLQIDSSCINAGDPCFAAEPDEIDIDNDPRVIADWVDIGADEFSGNLEPVADAGYDQTYGSIPSQVALDGSGSYDLKGDSLTYQWQQIEGPDANLSDPNAIAPTFTPFEFGIYVFELIVNDGLLDSDPDIVGIVIGNNNAPVADAGLSRYAAQTPVVLDGTGSFDSDGYGELTYQWQQTSGALLTIVDANTATPTISGFTQTSSMQACEFELIVNDGALSSPPNTVDVIIVPSFSANTMNLENYAFVADKPTMVFFGGGNCSSGGATATGMSDWKDNANVINFIHYEPPYGRCGDMLIAYLSQLAPNYQQPIQTMGHSTGNIPAIAIAKYLNMTYQDARYAVNRVSFCDAVCNNLSSEVAVFNSNPVDGEQCWVDNYYHGAAIITGALNVYMPNTDHPGPVSWYQQSFEQPMWKTDIYNHGIVAGGYLSIAGSGKNLQLATGNTTYFYKWIGDFYFRPLIGYVGSGYLDFYNESSYPGRLPEPVTLIGPQDAAVVDANGALLTCEVSENAVGYQLLFGPDPYRVQDYNVISDTPEPPNEIIIEVPFEETWWTVKAYDQYGSTIYADPRSIRINAKPVADAGDDKVVYTQIDKPLQVTLNGSGSYDPDDDIISYYWSWVIDGNIYESNDVSPTIELPTGEHLIELIVNDDLDVSEPDEVFVKVLSPVDAILEMSELIEAMDIHKGIYNSLLAKLDAALEKLEDDNKNNDIAAINILKAFINAVNAQHGKNILETDADVLIDTVHQIIDLLNRTFPETSIFELM